MKVLREFEHNGKIIQIVVLEIPIGPLGGYQVWGIYAESGHDVNGFAYGVNQITRDIAQNNDNFDLLELMADVAKSDIENERWERLMATLKGS